ncbi:MAG: hypothetical protein ACI3U8_04830, partial [Candidatus Onthomonas sp.]
TPIRYPFSFLSRIIVIPTTYWPPYREYGIENNLINYPTPEAGNVNSLCPDESFKLAKSN